MLLRKHTEAVDIQATILDEGVYWGMSHRVASKGDLQGASARSHVISPDLEGAVRVRCYSDEASNLQECNTEHLLWVLKGFPTMSLWSRMGNTQPQGLHLY